MRTMYLSQELNTGKKKFQKPNILRRRSKVSVQKSDISHVNVSPQAISSVTQSEHLTDNPLLRLQVEISRPEITPFQIKNDNAQKYIWANDIKEETKVSGNNYDCNIDNISLDNTASVNSNENIEQYPLNIESFLKSAIQKDTPTELHKNDNVTKNYWCFEFFNGSSGALRSKYNSTSDDGSQLRNIDINPVLSHVEVEGPPVAVSPAQNVPCGSQNTVTTTTESQFQNVSNNDIINKDVMLKSSAIVSQIATECPFKKINGNGVEEQCGRIYLTNEDLLKHLNEDHTPDDDIYRCTSCGGMSAHGEGTTVACAGACAGVRRRVRAARGPLMCVWPGCGREFRLPCRLREHARAHTGDRPYPCLFPNCGWSFRSASKLVRHARRHTGERRHACASCGRAFHRREHLRDHCARTHPDRSPDAPGELRTEPAQAACTYPECEETFPSASAMHTHRRKIHKKAESSKKESSAATRKNRSNMFVMSLVAESKNEDENTTLSETVLAERSIIEEMEMENAGEASRESGGEGSGVPDVWQSARTHCTWPLADRHRPLYERALDAAYVLEEDTPAEQSESSENNIYTIRSDLFLHGNVLINEDSEFIVSREYMDRVSGGITEVGGVTTGEDEEGGSGDSPAEHAHALDTGLDLIDAHPTIDLMQEELMYADTAVDESSFRVFFA